MTNISDLSISFFLGSRLFYQHSKKVIKIWDLGIGFILGSRLKVSDQDLGFGVSLGSR